MDETKNEVAIQFQLTHSRGVRPRGVRALTSNENFNSRTHVECDLLPLLQSVPLCDFNSRTHVECDRAAAAEPVLFDISTHALTWSATGTDPRSGIPMTFQLTHSRGVRPLWDRYRDDITNFNSRTHVECDAMMQTKLELFTDFNSRTHVECD